MTNADEITKKNRRAAMLLHREPLDDETQRWVDQGTEEQRLHGISTATQFLAQGNPLLGHNRGTGKKDCFGRLVDWRYRHLVRLGATEREARKVQILHNRAMVMDRENFGEARALWQKCLTAERRLERKYNN